METPAPAKTTNSRTIRGLEGGWGSMTETFKSRGTRCRVGPKFPGACLAIFGEHTRVAFSAHFGERASRI